MNLRICSPGGCLGSVLLALTISTVSLGWAQTADQVRSALEGRRFSQDELNRKLKEMGMTYEEAAKRARDLGLNVEDYLRVSSSSTSSTVLSPFYPQLPQEFLNPVADSLRRDSDQTRERTYIVPGFANRQGVDSALQPFGYRIFDSPPSLFEPVLNVSTPPSYVLGPGDEVLISVWGETKLYHQLVVNREGNILVPDVGPVSAYGQTIQQFRERIVRRMTSVYSGLRNGAPGANTFLDVSLGRLRTIQVFVLGEVVRPGGFQVSSMSTAFHAMYLAGGPTVDGSMREVQVIRLGSTLAPVDLYEILLGGSKSSDIRLQDGDVVFAKPTLRRAAIQGVVVRPGIYELKKSESLSDLIRFAGGLRFTAYTDRVHLERVLPFEQRGIEGKNITDVDLRFPSFSALIESSFPLEDGDIATIRPILEEFRNRVFMGGTVRKPGPYEYREGMTVRDLILAADSLMRESFTERGTLFRMRANLRREVLVFNPRLAIEGVESENLRLQNEDSVLVYAETDFFPRHTVTIDGGVRNPGRYQRHETMTPTDLAILAGGLTEYATTKGWEISRAETTKVGVFRQTFKMDFDEEYWKNTKKVYLEDFDHVLVPLDPRKSVPKVATVGGYVMYPGTYSIRFEGERVASLIRRAGGLRAGAYPAGSRLVRKANNAGLIPIDFEKALRDTLSSENIEVVDGDSIHVARLENVVYVRGEVFVPSAVLHVGGGSLSYYIQQAGGYKDEADEGRVVVFLPSGKKWESSWLSGQQILPGSVVYVPRKIEKEDNTLPIIRDLATMLASLAAITLAIYQATK